MLSLSFNYILSYIIKFDSVCWFLRFAGSHSSHTRTLKAISHHSKPIHCSCTFGTKKI